MTGFGWSGKVHRRQTGTRLKNRLSDSAKMSMRSFPGEGNHMKTAGIGTAN